MAKAINMPQIGQDIEKGRILEWYVKEGDRVEQGDVVATVESDKALFEVEAFESGTLLKILFDVGEEAEVFKPIAYIGDGDEELDETTQENEMTSDKAIIQPDKTNAATDDQPDRTRIFASPTAKRMAREHHLALEEIPGSGPNGRIVKRDILSILAGIDAERDHPSEDAVIPFSPMRMKIAERLTYSKSHIPHYYLVREANVSRALDARKRFNENNALHLSINDLIIYSAARTLKHFPNLNAHVEANKLILKKNINIGLAVSVEDGLLVPVIRDADRKSLQEISSISRDIAEKAREGKISGGMPGTFTISNLGMYGISRFQAIINPPECAILSVGAVEKKAVEVQDGIAFTDFINLGLACDHRVIDGAYAAQFLEALSRELDNMIIN